MEIKQISVIGAGTMGNGIAHVFAQYGFKVNLIDVKEEFLDKAIKMGVDRRGSTTEGGDVYIDLDKRTRKKFKATFWWRLLEYFRDATKVVMVGSLTKMLDESLKEMK